MSRRWAAPSAVEREALKKRADALAAIPEPTTDQVEERVRLEQHDPTIAPVDKDKIRVIDRGTPYEVPRDSELGKKVAAMVPEGTDVVNLVGPLNLRPPSPEQLGLLMADKILEDAAQPAITAEFVAGGINPQLLLLRAARELQVRCRCSHQRGAHGDDQHDGACGARRCPCPKFRRAL